MDKAVKRFENIPDVDSWRQFVREEQAERTYGGVIDFVVGNAYPLSTNADSSLRKEATYFLQAVAWQLLNAERFSQPPPTPVVEAKKSTFGKLSSVIGKAAKRTVSGARKVIVLPVYLRL